MQVENPPVSLLRGTMLHIAMVFLLSACAIGGGTRLTIDTRDVPAVEDVPKEVTSMLRDLGYEEISETDAERRVRTFEDYKMQFKARDDENIRVDVDFKLINQLTAIHLYNINEKTPGAATLQRYDTLRKRVEWAFGADSVN